MDHPLLQENAIQKIDFYKIASRGNPLNEYKKLKFFSEKYENFKMYTAILRCTSENGVYMISRQYKTVTHFANYANTFFLKEIEILIIYP